MPGNPEHDENSHGADGFRGLAVCEPRLTNDVSVVPNLNAFRRAS